MLSTLLHSLSLSHTHPQTHTHAHMHTHTHTSTPAHTHTPHTNTHTHTCRHTYQSDCSGDFISFHTNKMFRISTQSSVQAQETVWYEHIVCSFSWWYELFCSFSWWHEHIVCSFSWWCELIICSFRWWCELVCSFSWWRELIVCSFSWWHEHIACSFGWWHELIVCSFRKFLDQDEEVSSRITHSPWHVWMVTNSQPSTVAGIETSLLLAVRTTRFWLKAWLLVVSTMSACKPTAAGGHLPRPGGSCTCTHLHVSILSAVAGTNLLKTQFVQLGSPCPTGGTGQNNIFTSRILFGYPN